jgi:transcriptional regulator with GAF, ATPase, and Fis domain
MTSEITRTIHLEGGEHALRLKKYTLTIPELPLQPLTFDKRQVYLGSSPENDACLDNPSVSRIHARIEVDGIGYRLIDLDSKNGTFINGLRVRDVYLQPGSTFQLGHQPLTFHLTSDEVEVRFSKRHQFGDIIGQSLEMREIFSLLERISPTSATALIEGESGTGKELIAEAIHAHSLRQSKPFIVFDCSAVSRDLIESELFGHVKGAFTGAVQTRKGAFEQADGGTLFLDELGELGLDLQPKLLRALEKREVRPVGSDRTIPVDVRIVAATNRNLLREVDQSNFREDLYYRFAVIRILLPPLRKRPDDITLLAEHFLAQCQTRIGRDNLQIPFRTMEKLRRHTWPGNVRELKNYIERAALLAQDNQIETRFLQPEAAPTQQNTTSPNGHDDASNLASNAADEQLPFKDAKQQLIEVFEKSYWTRLLERTDGNVSKAARIAGVHRKSVEYILKKLDISRKDIAF